MKSRSIILLATVTLLALSVNPAFAQSSDDVINALDVLAAPYNDAIQLIKDLQAQVISLQERLTLALANIETLTTNLNAMTQTPSQIVADNRPPTHATVNGTLMIESRVGATYTVGDTLYITAQFDEDLHRRAYYYADQSPPTFRSEFMSIKLFSADVEPHHRPYICQIYTLGTWDARILQNNTNGSPHCMTHDNQIISIFYQIPIDTPPGTYKLHISHSMGWNYNPPYYYYQTGATDELFTRGSFTIANSTSP